MLNNKKHLTPFTFPIDQFYAPSQKQQPENSKHFSIFTALPDFAQIDYDSDSTDEEVSPKQKRFKLTEKLDEKWRVRLPIQKFKSMRKMANLFKLVQ
jgi:hypothetical protein